MNGIYILLGSNMGNRLEYLREAESLITMQGIRILEESSIYETEPWGGVDQRWFLNVILQIETSVLPHDLLKTLLQIENKMGRIRHEKWGERCIDIDILYFHSEIIEETQLTIPHLGIPDRRFTLIPLSELCPFEKHPKSNKTHLQLLAECTDTLDCKITNYNL